MSKESIKARIDKAEKEVIEINRQISGLKSRQSDAEARIEKMKRQLRGAGEYC